MLSIFFYSTTDFLPLDHTIISSTIKSTVTFCKTFTITANNTQERITNDRIEKLSGLNICLKQS